MSATPQDPYDRPHHEDPDRPTGRSTEAGRRRGRILIPLMFVAAIVLVFLFILLVSQIGQ